MINREATIRWKGYDPDDLPSNSSKRVWANCESCSEGRWVNLNQYRDLCYKCAMVARRGIKRSPEVCKKISESNMGRIVSEDTKRKMRENRPDMSGENNPMFGKQHTDEAKRLISENIKQYYIDNPEAGAENSARQIQYAIDHTEKGEKHSKDIIQFYIAHPEAGKAHSEFMIEYFSNQANRDDQAVRMIQYYKDNPEVIDAISKERLEYWDGIPIKERYWYGRDFSPDHIKNISDAKIEYFSDPANRKALSEIVIEQMNRPGARDKMRELHSRPDVAEKHRAAMLRRIGSNSMPFRNTSIELKMQQILEENEYSFSTHIPLCKICIPDIVLEDKKIIVQCDGDYWHNYPDGLEKDHKQDEVLTKNGWRVIRFWEHEINKNIQDCLRKFEAVYNDTEYTPYYTQGTLDDWM